MDEINNRKSHKKDAKRTYTQYVKKNEQKKDQEGRTWEEKRQANQSVKGEGWSTVNFVWTKV